MSYQETGSCTLTAVANSYYKCCKETHVTPKSFANLTQAFVRYYHTQTQKYHIEHKLLNSKAFDYTNELGDELRPIIELLTAQYKEQRLHHGWPALLDTSAFIAVLSSSQPSSQDGRHKPSEVLREETYDCEELLNEIVSRNASHRENGISMAVTRYTALPLTAQVRCVKCLLRCLKDTREQADRFRKEPSRNPARDTMISDLRNAFRGQFYESRSESSLSSLDRLNLVLRANLFMTYYSILVRRDRSVSAPSQGLPFYPYIALLQSSGSGKSRLLHEVGQTLPMVYGNLNAADSKGYPFPNNRLRRSLLWQGDAARDAEEAASDQCEKRCETLLLVTVIVLYLLFSSRDDRRKKLIIPRAEVLQRKIEEGAA